MFTDMMARQAKGTGKPCVIADFDCLYLYGTEPNCFGSRVRRMRRKVSSDGIPFWRRKKAAQPRFFLAPPESDALDGVVGRQNGRNHDDQDFPEVMEAAVARPVRIIDFGQTADQGCPLRRTHALRPEGESKRDF